MLLNQALRIDPSYITAWYNKGKLLREMGRFKESMACCEKIAALDPNYPDLWTMLGNNLLNIDRNEEAISAFKKALTIDNTDLRAWYNKAEGEMAIDMYLEAKESYTQFIRLAPVEHYKDQIERARSIIALLEKANKQSP